LSSHGGAPRDPNGDNNEDGDNDNKEDDNIDEDSLVIGEGTATW